MSNVTIRVLLAAALGCWVAAPARAQAPAPSTAMTIYGPGTVSCATYLQDRSLRINADGWILGFWTGMNEEDDTTHQVGKTTDARGIVAQVAQICRAQPVQPLYKTVRDIYKQMKSDGS